MKILTKEEEDAHYAQVVKGGVMGLAFGLGVGVATSALMTKKWPLYRTTTIPFKAFYICSSSTFFGIIQADRYSRAYEEARRTDGGESLEQIAARKREERLKTLSTYDRWMEYGRENRYKIVFASWLASMGISGALVYNNKFLTKSQKIVQSRVYAQGLTLLVLIASAAFEVSDRHNPGQKKHVEHYPGEDAWKDIIAKEEQKQKAEAEAAAAAHKD